MLGGVASGLAGYIGMTLATRGNVRTAAAARNGSMAAALKVAFRTGGVAGMFTVGLGLLGATVIIVIFQNTSSAILVGFGFGGSLLALFLRVGGGIFTKAADVGADLVGKVEAGIPEDDPRNPATIADNVGDNVGDCAGMAADLFESYEVTLVASIILGVAAFKSVGMNPALGLVSRSPLAPSASSRRSPASTPCGPRKARPTRSSRSTAASSPPSIITLIGTLSLALGYVGNENLAGETTNIGWKCFFAVVIGLVLAQGVSRLTEYFTGTHYGPVQEIARSARTGPATTVLSGTASGLESSVYAIIAIAVAIGAAIGLGGGNLQLSLYLVALCGMGMLATTGVIVSEDTFGPVADNAAGIAEMSGEFSGEAEKIMVSLDAVGNTTKAVTKGFAIGSAVIAAVALFASFIETAAGELLPREQIDRLLTTSRGVFDVIPINVADPKTFIGLLIGGSIPFMFSASPSAPSVAPPASWCRRCVVSSPTARSWPAPSVPTTPPSSTSARRRRCASSPPRRCSRCSRRPSSASVSASRRSVRSSPRSSSPVSSWPTTCRTRVARGTTPRSTSRTATKAARAPRRTRPRSSATPSATRSRTPPVRRSTRSSR